MKVIKKRRRGEL